MISFLSFEKFAAWLRVKKLEREFSQSEKFQKQCEQMSCFHLAELEKGYRAEISAEIRRLKENQAVR